MSKKGLLKGVVISLITTALWEVVIKPKLKKEV